MRLAGAAEGVLEATAAEAAGHLLEAGAAHGAGVLLDDERRRQHDQEADEGQREVDVQREDQEDEAERRTGARPT